MQYFGCCIRAVIRYKKGFDLKIKGFFWLSNFEEALLTLLTSFNVRMIGQSDIAIRKKIAHYLRNLSRLSLQCLQIAGRAHNRGIDACEEKSLSSRGLL